MKDIQNLLTQIAIITKKNTELLDSTGGRFNLFKVMGVDHYENTHSAILAELLNPLGSHGLRHKFLHAFNMTIGLNSYMNEFDTESATIRTEVSVGNGRIDILIEDHKSHGIIIENKIYAGDQQEQLIRYDEFAKNKFGVGNYKILYLTLNRSAASENSSAGIEYVPISYAIDIIQWLEQCVNLSSRFPLVRESMNQYIGHIKNLTNQDMDTKNKEEVVKILSSSEENLHAALSVFENIGALKEYLAYTYFNSQLNEIAKVLEIRVLSELHGRKIDSGFCFEVPCWKYFKIEFGFDGNDWMKLGYWYSLKVDKEKPNETIEKLSPKFECKNKNASIPCGYSYRMKYNNWNNDAFLAIRSGEMKNEIKRIVEMMIDQTKGLEM